MKKIEVKKFYNELNEIEDCSGDYVEVTMPRYLWTEVLTTILLRSYQDKKVRNLYEVLNDKTRQGKSEWYK